MGDARYYRLPSGRFLEEAVMAKFVSLNTPISACALKRKAIGSVVLRHWSCGEVRFTRVTGGWRAEREGVPAEVVSSAAVAAECNKAPGCKDSWARVY